MRRSDAKAANNGTDLQASHEHWVADSFRVILSCSFRIGVLESMRFPEKREL